MKNLILSILLFLSYTTIKSQCIANAGNDTVVCVGLYGMDTIQIGRNPVAIGAAPFTYKWEATETNFLGITHHASYFLNDTTTANPKVIKEGEPITYNPNGSNPPPKITFYLTVTDANGFVCTDTVLVQFSKFMISLSYFERFINQGDSTFFNWTHLMGSSFPPPYDYLWTPGISLSDSTLENPWAKPSVTTEYSLRITDAGGCTSESNAFYKIHITPTSIDEFVNKLEFTLFPNPLKDISILRVKNNNKTDLSIEFYDELGRTVQKIKISEEETRINKNVFKTGIYFYKLFDENKPVGAGKLIVN